MIRLEVPKFRRCCFCVPLRYGLLASGYARLAIIILLLLLILFMTMQMYFVPSFFVLFVALGFLLCMADIGFSILFIIGAHKKDYKLIRIYYYFAMASLGVTTLIFIFIIGIQIYSYSHYTYSRVLSAIIIEVTFYGLFLVLQGYLILLIRSEVLKLKGGSRFEFINNAAEADPECRLDVNSEAMAARMQDN